MTTVKNGPYVCACCNNEWHLDEGYDTVTAMCSGCTEYARREDAKKGQQITEPLMPVPNFAYTAGDPYW